MFKFLISIFILCLFPEAYAQQSVETPIPKNVAAGVGQIIKNTKEYLKDKDYDAAIKEITKAISLFPEDDSLYYFRGEAYYTKMGTAIDSYIRQRQGKLDPLDPAWPLMTENILSLVEAATEDFDKAIIINPINPLYFYALARTLWQASLFGNDEYFYRAISYLDKAISLKNDIAIFYYDRGKLYGNLDRLDKSIEDYTTTIKILKTQRQKPLSSFVKYYDAGSNLYYDDSINTDKFLGELYYDRARAYKEIGQQQKAYDDYKQGLILKPESDTVDITIRYGKIEDAEIWFKLLNNLIKRQPKYASIYKKKLASVYYRRGKEYENLGQQQKAYNNYKQFLILDPDSYEVEEVLKTFQIIMEKDENAKSEKIDRALKLLNDVISQQSKSAKLYKYRADMYSQKKQYQKASEDYTKAIEIKPKDADAYLYLSRGYAYEMLNQVDNAIKDYSKAIKLEPNEAGYYSSRGDLYVKKEFLGKAIADFEKACEFEQELKFKEIYCNTLEELRKAEKRGTKWVHYADGGNASFFYDKTSIKKHTHSTVRVWTRTEVKDISEHTKWRKEKFLSTKGYDKFSHSITLNEYDCSNNAIAIVSDVDYDVNGNVLDYFNIEKPKFTPIVPDSLSSILFERVCKGYIQQLQEKSQKQKRKKVS